MAEKPIPLTKEGLAKLQEELGFLITVRRPQIARRIQEAKELTSAQNNAEFDDAKNEQAFVEGRILELKLILQNASVIEESEVPTDVVGVGSRVIVRDLSSKDEWEYTIVGSVEADPSEDRISNESPVGEALMDRKVGAVVKVDVPAGKARYKIIKISR